MSTDYDVRLLAFDRTGAGASYHPEARRLACEALSKFADVSVVPVPQDLSRRRFVWDHIRSLIRRRSFTHYRHDQPEFTGLLRDALESKIYDIIHVDSLDLARYLPELDLDRVVLTHHNVESELLRERAVRERLPLLRAYVLQQASLQEQAEKEWCPRVRLNVTVSERDATELERIAPGSQTVTIPNGVDISSCGPNGRTSKSNGAASGSVVCVGGLGWFPNQDGLEYLCEEILPQMSFSRAGKSHLGRPGLEGEDRGVREALRCSPNRLRRRCAALRR